MLISTAFLLKFGYPVKPLAGNFGYLPLMVVPAMCNEKDNPFGDSSTCYINGLAYACFSHAVSDISILDISFGTNIV